MTGAIIGRTGHSISETAVLIGHAAAIVVACMMVISLALRVTMITCHRRRPHGLPLFMGGIFARIEKNTYAINRSGHYSISEERC